MLHLVLALALSVPMHIMSGGIERTYHVYQPPNSSGRAVPMVIVLHGGFGTGPQAERAYGWDAAAQRYGFIAVFPDGLDRAWNAANCCGSPQLRGIDDVAFIDSVIADVEKRNAVDRSRVVVAGMSNGAMMAYRMACESHTPLYGIASASGTMVVPCQNARPARILEIHGLQDRNIPFNGGRGDGFAHVTGPSIPSVMSRWQRIDQCGAAVSRRNGVLDTSVASCANGMFVELIVIADAAHQWPGSAWSFAAPPSRALDATDTISRMLLATATG